MRALDPEVLDALWEAVEPLVPVLVDNHPTGGHRRRIPDRIVFWGMLIRLMTLAHRGDRLPLRAAMPLGLEHHPHRPLAQLIRIPPRTPLL